MPKDKSLKKISSSERLESLLEEAEKELSLIQPKIDRLEKQMDQLKELKLAKQKLITLKLSVKSILSNFNPEKRVALQPHELTLSSDLNLLNNTKQETLNSQTKTKTLRFDSLKTKHLTEHLNDTAADPPGSFLPDLAFQQADTLLRKKTSINYDLFRAIVFNGGRASTEAIRQYLVDNHICQPASGESFEKVALTDISSRVNYLVRKGIVKPSSRGTFVSCLGWANPDA